MSNYILYKCDTCQREIETELDPLRPFIDRCNITFKCEGHLKKIGETAHRSELLPLPQAGLNSWRQRGNLAPTIVAATAPIPVTVNSGDNVITLAVNIPPPYPASLTLNFNLLSNSARPFTEFTYNAPALSKIITGLDISSKNLRFTSVDDIVVYVNGVMQYDIGQLATYTRDNATSSVKFNQPFLDNSTVKVVVYGQVTDSPYNLTASRGTLSTSCWGNVDTVQLGLATYAIYHINTSSLPINFYYTLAAVKDGVVVIPFSNTMLLLAKRPFRALDRLYHIVLPLGNAPKFNKQLVDKVIDFRVVSDKFADQYPPLIVNRYPGYMDDNSIAAGFALAQNSATSTYVIGPAV